MPNLRLGVTGPSKLSCSVSAKTDGARRRMSRRNWPGEYTNGEQTAETAMPRRSLTVASLQGPFAREHITAGFRMAHFRNRWGGGDSSTLRNLDHAQSWVLPRAGTLLHTVIGNFRVVSFEYERSQIAGWIHVQL